VTSDWLGIGSQKEVILCANVVPESDLLNEMSKVGFSNSKLKHFKIELSHGSVVDVLAENFDYALE
jgi:hypothetical protein